jgi:hypothetical protein
MTTLPKCAHCSIFPRSRRSLLATLAGAATALVVPLHHPTVASPGSPDDETFCGAILIGSCTRRRLIDRYQDESDDGA